MDRRAEVRLLEYHEIPGISIENSSLKIQKFVASSKRVKTDHMGCNGQAGLITGSSHNL